jgi:hypothetical protein
VWVNCGQSFLEGQRDLTRIARIANDENHSGSQDIYGQIQVSVLTCVWEVSANQITSKANSTLVKFKGGRVASRDDHTAE